MTAPEVPMQWAPDPATAIWHAVASGDVAKSRLLGHCETLCGQSHIPHAGLEPRLLPAAPQCLACLIGATADLRILDDS